MSIAALVFSFSALFVKLIAGRVPTFEIVAFRSFLSFLACAWGAHKAGISPLFGQRKNLYLLIARGMFGAAVSARCVPARALRPPVHTNAVNTITAIVNMALSYMG